MTLGTQLDLSEVEYITCLITPPWFGEPQFEYEYSELVEYLGLDDAYALLYGLYDDSLASGILTTLRVEDRAADYSVLIKHMRDNYINPIPPYLLDRSRYEYHDTIYLSDTLLGLRFHKLNGELKWQN